MFILRAAFYFEQTRPLHTLHAHHAHHHHMVHALLSDAHANTQELLRRLSVSLKRLKQTLQEVERETSEESGEHTSNNK